MQYVWLGGVCIFWMLKSWNGNTVPVYRFHQLAMQPVIFAFYARFTNTLMLCLRTTKKHVYVLTKLYSFCASMQSQYALLLTDDI